VIRVLLRVAIIGGFIAWLGERWLATTLHGGSPRPIHSRVVVDAPIEAVWRELADIEGQPRWMHDMKAVRVLGRGPVGVGTRAEADVRIFGMAVVDPISITAFDPPRRLAIRHEGRFGGEGVIELEPGADGRTTTVRWDETIVPPYLPLVSSAILRPILEGVFQADLDRLRVLVEGGSVRG
jgi:uncharacterized protein YndB with AHSA1/START domain